MAETLTSKPAVNAEQKAHRWRRCPIGKHFVREHLEHIPPSKAHPDGIIITRHEHCADNPSHKDELSYDEIQYITETYFSDLKGLPTANALLELFPKSDHYDAEIRGWTQYWNDIFKPSDPLNPNLVKALIATESSFEIDPEGTTGVYGLTQIKEDTLGYLSDVKGELKNYLIRISVDQLLNPSANICSAVRWLFRKKEIASSRLGREATWFEAAEDYKSILKKRLEGKKYNPKPMNDLQDYYKKLQKYQNEIL